MTWRLLAALALASMAARSARGESLERPWYVGLPVVQVSLEASDGGLPGENLEPLLRVRQGSPYRPRAVRDDLAMLYRLGQFAAVEAHVESWVGYDAENMPFQAVRLVYLVKPPPRIRRIRVSGGDELSRREILALSGLAKHDAFYEERDILAVPNRIRQHYARIGFPQAEVSLRVMPLDGRRLDLLIQVREGPQQKLSSLNLLDMPNQLQARAARLLRREGLREGRRFERAAVLGAKDRLVDLLADKGYPEAEVKVLLVPAAEDRMGSRLTYVVQAGRQVRIRVEGVGWGARRELRQELSAVVARRVSEEILEEAEARLLGRMQERGWLAAEVDVEAQDDGDARDVLARVERGARHRLGEIRFQGAETYSQRFLANAVKEASPTVLGKGRVTEEEVRRSLKGVEEFYRSKGFLSIQLQLESMEGRQGRRRRVPVDLEILVREGGRTFLAAMAAEGDGVPEALEVLERARPQLVGQPLNPAEMEGLARQMAESCWEQGYLDADVEVLLELQPNSDAARVRFLVETGPRVVLRNTIIQGHRHTRRRVIEREIQLTMGEPVTRSGLVETRRRLYDLGLFSRVETDLIGDEDRVKDLLLEVDEYPRIHFDIGGGASTDQGVRAFLRSTHRNLWGRAHRLSLVTQAGLAYQGDDWRLDTTRPEWSAGLRYEAPNIPADEQRLFLDLLLNEEKQHTSFRLARSGGGPGVETPVAAAGKLVMDYRVELRRIDDVDPGVLLEHDPWLERLGLPEQLDSAEQGESFDAMDSDDPTLPSGYRRASGPGFLLVADARDDPQNPSRGTRWTLQARVGDGILSEDPLVVARSQLVQLVPVRRMGLLLGLQAGIGQVLDMDICLPLEERFRLGGAGSLRGYRQDTVGPKNRLPAYDPGYPPEIEPALKYARRSDPYRWVATGGDAMLAATLELKVPLPLLGLKSWSDAALVGFVDAGNAFLLNPLARTSSGEEGGEPLLRSGVGVGFHYATPIGPLRLDLGVNPSPLEERDEVPARLHLSLGSL